MSLVARFNALGRAPSAIVVGIGLGLIGYWVGAHLASGGSAGDLLGYLSGAAGFLITLGFADNVLLRLRGRPTSTDVKRAAGKRRAEYLGISLDHKVVGMQFAVGAVLLAVALVLILVL